MPKIQYREIAFRQKSHDPSGIDMTRDIQERLEMFGADVHVKRVADEYQKVVSFLSVEGDL